MKLVRPAFAAVLLAAVVGPLAAADAATVCLTDADATLDTVGCVEITDIT